MGRLVLALLAGNLLLAIAAPAAAGDPGVQLVAQRGSIAVGEATTVQVVVDGAIEGVPELPASAGVQVQLRGRSEQTVIRRGRAEARAEFSYLVEGLSPGTATLGPAKVRVDGQSRRSDSVEIEVVPGRRAAGGGTGGAPRAAAPDGDGSEAASTRPTSGKRGGDWYAIASVSEARPFVGQAFAYVVEVGSRVRQRGIQWEQPSLGTLSVEPGMETAQDEEPQLLDGSRYDVNTLTMPIFGAEAGDTRIGPARFTMSLLQRVGGFLNTTREVNFESNTVPVTVRPLPSSGRPPAFGGAVGTYELEALLDRNSVQAGETATLTVTVKGQGALRSPPLSIAVPEGIRAYDEAPAVKVDLADGKVWSRAVFKKALVPLEPGQYTVEPPEFAYFDPELEEYRTASARPLSLRVTGSSAVADPGVVARSHVLDQARGQVEVLGSDILPLHDGERMLGDRRVRLASPLVLVLFLLPLFAFGTAAASSTRRRLAGTETGARWRRDRALGEAQQRAKRAAAAADLGAAERALRDWLSLRLGRAGGALSPHEASEVLRAAGAPADLAAELGTLLDRLEAARFGGGTAQGLAGAVQDWIDAARRGWKP